MGTSLSGLTPANTYTGLLKFGDNSAISASLKVISDGAGNDTILSLSTSSLNIGGTGLSARVGIKGSGSTSATTSLLVQNSAGSTALQITDDQIVTGYSSSVLRFRFGGSSQPLVSTRNGAFCIGLVDGGSANNTFKINVNSSSGKSYLDGWDTYDIVIGNNGCPVQIGTDSSVASAQLTVNSTTRGFLPPRMTTTQKNAIATTAAGLVVYDTTLAKLCVYTTSWETITSL